MSKLSLERYFFFNDESGEREREMITKESRDIMKRD